jgi:chromosomal replication initiator protein
VFNGVLSIPLPGELHPEDAPLPAGLSHGRPLGEFIAGSENCLAVSGVMALASDNPPRPCGYNPLVLYGPPGTGKSHLAGALAIAHRRRDPQAKIVHLFAVDFSRELSDAIETQSIGEWELRHRQADLLIIEDLDHLAPRPAAQDQLARTFDAIAWRSGQVLVTSRVAPCEATHLTPALRSRLSGGLSIPLALPGLTARLEILRLLAAERDIRLTAEALQCLATSVGGGVRELLGSLVYLETAAGSAQSSGDAIRTFGLEQVNAYLATLRVARVPTIAAIAARTAKYYSVRLADLRGPGRQKNLALARNVATYLARQLTGLSFERIGSYFGGRDHTTAIYACRKVSQLAAGDPDIRRTLSDLEQALAH